MNIIDSALGLIAPHICLGCELEGAVLCRSCALTYPTLPSICYICARATTQNTPCREHTIAHGPQRVYIAGDYSGVLQELIHAYKFDYRRAASKDIALLLDIAVPFLNDVTITYVPATGAHIRERGFNHIKNISKLFASIRKLPLAETLIRTSAVTQKGANKVTRKKQLRGAFMALPAKVNNKNILLIDDVITTGATIEECARQLYGAGAQSVSVAAVARTP
jgi:ComF family protein